MATREEPVAEIMKEFIKQSINLFLSGVTMEQYNFTFKCKKKGNLNDIILWDPLSISTVNLSCPNCDGENLPVSQTHRWKDASNKSDSPRTLYGIHGDILLVSRIYCCTNGHHIIAHNVDILKQLSSSSDVEVPFLLLHRSGLTKKLYEFFVSHLQVGMKSQEVLVLWQQTMYNSFVNTKASMETVPMLAEFKYIGARNGEKLIQDCFQFHYFSNKHLFTQRMCQMKATWISADHTFKVPANVGFWRNGQWVKLYDTLFIILNENANVMAWQFCKGSKFQMVENLFQGIKRRLEHSGDELELICVDNCCQWRKSLQSVFTNITVKLDLFHGVQRIVSSIPKRKGTNSLQRTLRRRMLLDLRMVFRDSNDQENARHKPTPSPEVILANLVHFENTWKSLEDNVIPQKALEAIQNLKKHVEKGCLSQIPVSCGTNRNEGLHRTLNRFFKTGRIGIKAAVAALGQYFYRWNEGIVNGKHLKKNVRVTPPVECYRKQLDGFESEEVFGTGFVCEAIAYEDAQGEAVAELHWESGDESCSDLETDEVICEAKNAWTMTVKDCTDVLDHSSLISRIGKHIENLGETAYYRKEFLPFSAKTPLPKSSDKTLLQKALSSFKMITIESTSTDALGTLYDSVQNFVESKLSSSEAKLHFQCVGCMENSSFMSEISLRNIFGKENDLETLVQKIADYLRIPIIIFVGCLHTAVIPIVSKLRPLLEQPMYLAFDGTKIFRIEKSASIHVNPCNAVRSLKKECRCGKGANKAKEVLSCDKMRCPCFGSLNGCSDNCKCSKCNNPHGKRKQEVNKLPMKRKRSCQSFLGSTSSGESFARKNEHLSIPAMKWNPVEYIVLQDIAHRMLQESVFDLQELYILIL